jgi:predicted dinucleotide-binding enzyme
MSARPVGLVAGMRIAIIGTGAVAKALATGYTRHGHVVRIGTRNPDNPDVAEWSPGPSAEVVADADLVVLAVPGKAAVDLAGGLADELTGKVVIDATNPIDNSHGDVRLFTLPGESLGEQVQAAAPAAKVVKAYNSVGNAFMVDPDLPGGPPTMFIAGNDAGAKATVRSLLEETGWDVADYGPIEHSRAIEPLVLTWVTWGMTSGTWDHAFKLVRR